MKQLEGIGIPRNRIIDGRVFKVSSLNFPRLIQENVAYGLFNPRSFSDYNDIHGAFRTLHPRVYVNKYNNVVLKFGTGSYLNGADILGLGLISIEKYSSVSFNEQFKLDLGRGHDYKKISTFDPRFFGYPLATDVLRPKDFCQISIGSDVWIGRDCILKSTNPNKPLVIGDGAVIASDSVVVKNVPPYAIVGGNPAQIIKYRFPPHVVEALLRIKWWNWSLDKIHDNFRYFNDIERFISLHDKE